MKYRRVGICKGHRYIYILYIYEGVYFFFLLGLRVKYVDYKKRKVFERKKFF